MDMDIISIKISIFTKVSFLVIRKMVKELSIMKMDSYILDIGLIIKKKGKEF